MPLEVRIAALNGLSKKGQYYASGRFYRYGTPDARRYCEQAANDADAKVREAAADVLRFLSHHATLLRASQRDGPTDRKTLLRAASGRPHNETGNGLLRAAITSPAHSKASAEQPGDGKQEG